MNITILSILLGLLTITTMVFAKLWLMACDDYQEEMLLRSSLAEELDTKDKALAEEHEYNVQLSFELLQMQQHTFDVSIYDQAFVASVLRQQLRDHFGDGLVKLLDTEDLEDLQHYLDQLTSD